MSARDGLGEYVAGPAVILAAKVKAALEADPDSLLVTTAYGNFYVSRIELKYADGGVGEVCGYLVPDEAEGNTFEFYTPKRDGGA
jgi:hypothetical protein